MANIKGAYRNTKTGEWHYDFRIRGHRFRGKAGTKSRREAENLVKTLRRKAERDLEDLSGRGDMTFGAASTRWWSEVAQHRKDATDLEGYLANLQTSIGMKTPLTHIDDEKVAELIANRRQEGVSNRTVNATVIEVLRPIIRRAANIWKAKTADINWKTHTLKPPKNIEREASFGEEIALLEAMREDYRDMFLFDFLSGLRISELIGMKWPHIDLQGRRFGVSGKGGTVSWLPITDAMAEILERQPRLPGLQAVWTYAPRRKTRSRHNLVTRMPITYSGAQTEWSRARKRAGLASRQKDPVAGFRLHDIRHTTLTRIARSSGLLAAQKLGRHKDIATTRRYAFATDDDLRNAMNEAQSPHKIPHTIKK